MDLPPKNQIIMQCVFGASIALILFFESVFGILPMPENTKIAAQSKTTNPLNNKNVAIVNYFTGDPGSLFENKIKAAHDDAELFEYVEVVNGCDPYFEGECLNARSGAGEDYNVVMRLRNGIVFKVGAKTLQMG